MNLQKMFSTLWEVYLKKRSDVKGRCKRNLEGTKIQYLAGLEDDNEGALIVCTADKIHNLISMCSGCEKDWAAFLDKFNSPVDEKLWLYEEVLKTMRRKH